MPFTFFLAGSVLERLLLADTCPIIFDHEFIFGEKLPYSSHIALQKNCACYLFAKSHHCQIMGVSTRFHTFL